MKKLILAFIFSLVSTAAFAQNLLPPEPFGFYVNGLPAATSVGAGDQFYVRQGGISKQVPAASAVAPGAVANSNLANMPAQTRKCNSETSAHSPEDCNVTIFTVTDPRFGAKCDGATDDSTALQAAFTAASTANGTVYIPTGTCVYATGLTATAANFFRLTGDGNNAQLQYTGAGTAIAVSGGNVLIADHVQVNMTNTAAVGITLSGTSKSDFNHLFFTGGTQDITFTNSFETRIIENFFQNTQGASIFFTADGSASSSAIIGNIFHNWNLAAGGTAAIDLGGNPSLPLGGTGILIAQNDFEGLGASVEFRGGANFGTSVGGVQYAGNYYENTGPASNTSPPFKCDQFASGIDIVGSAFVADNPTLTDTIANCDNIHIAQNKIIGFALSFAGSTNVDLGNNTLVSSTISNAGWTAFTPVPTCGTATFTVNSARFKVTGKTTFFEADISVATIGTCTDPLQFTLPTTPNNTGAIAGADRPTGNVIFAECDTGAGSTTTSCHKTGVANWAAGDRLQITGLYENQ